MTVWLYPLVAAALGVLLTIQPLLNAILARSVGNPIGATAISLLVSFLSALAMLLVTGRAADLGRAIVAPVPWWVFLAGLVGMAFVLGAVVIAPKIGSAAFFISVVAGQLIGATIADQFGLLGLATRPISLERLLGLALVLAGAVLVQRG
ncbi:MAG: DMT family transporter [Amaricoccus sp.]